MRPLHHALAILVLPAVCVCTAQAQSSPAEVNAHFVGESSPAARDMLRYANYAINRIGVSLVREVQGALARHTPEDAVDLCHLKDIPMVNGTVSGMPRITSMKLTSLKVRDPANKPDAAEQLALDRIQYLMEHGESPPNLLIQRVEPADAPAEWRVYKPLGLMRQCATCHGPVSQESDALKAKLHELYPDDQATGYRPGQWRGVIRVTVADK